MPGRRNSLAPGWRGGGERSRRWAKIAVECHDQDWTFDFGKVGDNKAERGLCSHDEAFWGDAIGFGKTLGEHGGRPFGKAGSYYATNQSGVGKGEEEGNLAAVP